MEQHVLILPSGRQISSGNAGEDAIRQVKLTCCTQTGDRVLPGSVCAAMLEAELFATEGVVTAGERLTLCRGQTQVGVFYPEKPEQVSQHHYRITAYDAVSRLDREISGWLETLSFPMPLYQLAQQLCAYCGLELATEQIPNGSYPVEKFSRPGLTGRELMQWICQLCGRFCVADAYGRLELRWYTPATVQAGPEETGQPLQSYESGHLTLQSAAISAADGVAQWTDATQDWVAGHLILTAPEPLAQAFIYEGSCHRSDYQVRQIDAVRLAQTQEDVGGVYPPEGGEHVCLLTGNGLLTAGDTGQLQSLAQTLYEILRPVTYTPVTLRVHPDTPVQAGQILSYICGGKTYTAYITQSCRAAGYLELISVGTAAFDSATAVVNRRQEQVNGRLMTLELGVEGLRLENSLQQEAAAKVQLTVEGLRGEVTAQNEALTRLEQTAQAVQLTVQTVGQRMDTLETEGVSCVSTRQRHYTFDDTGLHICLEGEQMENTLDHTGMYVRRGGQTVLSATDMGVQAVDVSVGNYLRIGDHARIEDYGTNRTACFYI